MTALRIDTPAGFAPPVWLAHLARLGLRAHLEGSLPQEPGAAQGTLIPGVAREADAVGSEA